MNRDKYGIPILEKQEVDTKEICIEMISDNIYMEAANLKVEDLDCDSFKDFYGNWRLKDIKNLIELEEK